MTWLQPWAAWFLAGIPVIVLLYLLKVRRRPVAVSTLMFWQKVMQEQRRRALFQRLRSLLSLLLHLLIFALIVAALARPSLDRFVREGASTVVVVDVRARMKATEPDGQTRFAKALTAGMSLLRDASPSRQFALLTAGAQPTVAVPFTGNERTLRDAVQRLSATDAAGDLEPAVKLAEELLATRNGARQIVLLTDRASPPEWARRHPDLITRAVGSARDNAAIVRFAARPLPASPSTSEILLEVRNFSGAPLNTNLELRYDDRLLDLKPVSIAADGKQTLVFPSVPRPAVNARGQLTATLQVKDALAEDNIARVYLPPPRPVRALLITTGNVFVEKALSADPGLSFELLTPEAWSPAIAQKFDVVIFDGFVPPSSLDTNVLYLHRTPFDASGPALELPPLTDIDSTHPTLRLLNFSQTTILHAQPLALPAPAADWTYAAPLRSFDHALFIVGERHGPKPTRVAALGLDLTATDLPLRVAFPLLITNTAHWLAGTASEAPTSLRAGEVLPLSPEEKIPITPPVVGTFQPLTNGFYPITRERREQWLAVNTFDANESDLRVLGASVPSRAAAVRMPAVFAELMAWPLWRYLAFAALLLFTLEWSLFHRRHTE